MRILPCADAGLLVELDGLDQVLALYAALSGNPPAGVVELVPAARTLLLRFAPPEAAGPVAGLGATTGARGGAVAGAGARAAARAGAGTRTRSTAVDRSPSAIDALPPTRS